MRFETLEYIHKLLKEDMCKKKAEVEVARDLCRVCADDDSEEFKRLQSDKQELWSVYRTVADALDDFEDHDWR